MEEIIFLIIFIFLIVVFMKILMAMEIEQYFKQGAVLEIRLAYILFSIILAHLMTSALERIFSLSII